MYTPKRPKILNEDDDQNLFTFSKSKIECEFCHMEIDYAERWVHFNRHQQGINQGTTYYTHNVFDNQSARLPWYMHSIYQDRTVNRSRYELMNFTELSNSSPLIEFERLITKPFRTHFWINYKDEKTGDSVKDYFALNPKALSYEVYDTFGLKSDFVSESKEELYFKCSICESKFRKCPSVVQTVMSLLIHLLANHPNYTNLRAAALEDLKEIQEATGVRTYLDKPPTEYKPLLGHDFVFDPIYSREFMLPFKAAPVPTYCLLCFKDAHYNRPHAFASEHVKKLHKISIESCTTRIMCLTASRYGQPESIWCKNYPIPLAIVQCEDKSFYTWACPICKLTLKHSDALQMAIYLMIHMANLSGDCQSIISRIASLRRGGNAVIYARMDEITKELNKTRTIVGLWNTMFKGVTLMQIADQYFSVKIDEIYKSWLFKVNDKNPGFVRMDVELQEIERKFKVFNQTMKSKLNRIYICPYCYQYFPLVEHVLCHLKPEQCPKMSNFKILLDSHDILKAEKIIEKWNSC